MQRGSRLLKGRPAQDRPAQGRRGQDRQGQYRQGQYRLAEFRAAAAVACALPAGVSCSLGRAVGGAVALMPDLDGRRALVASHMARVMGRPLGNTEARSVVTDVFANYGRYWAESFRLPSLTPAEVEAGVVIVGREYLDAAIACGRGVIIAAPHLGGWEWGAIRLLMSGLPVTVAVEPLEPPEVFEWFVQFRTRLGMNVVPVGPGAGAAMLRALASGHVLCLLSDRLVGKASGVEVDFFGSKVMMPAGPVTLALRSGAPLLTAALYDGHDAGCHTLVFRPPLKLNPDDPGSLPLSETGPSETGPSETGPSETGPSETTRGQPGVGVAPVRLREKVSNGTQELARELEELISYAPTQWHLLQPNWPDDPPLRSLRSRWGLTAAGARERESR